MPDLRLSGLELQPAYATLARRNAVENAIALDVHEGNLADMPRPLRINFDHVIANPPYYPRGGTPSPNAGRAIALQIDTPLSAWVEAATRRLAPGG
ncbi:MAG: Methyltransferase small, partial [uncultured bacterium]